MERHRVEAAELLKIYKDETCLGVIFQEIEKELKTEQKVVCQYIVNGLAIEEKDEQRWATYFLKEVQTLEYLSEKNEVLLIDVFDGWLTALPDLIKGAEELAVRLKGESPRGVLKAVSELVGNCEFLMGSLLSGRQLLGDAHGASLIDFAKVEQMTRKTVREAMIHVEAQDFVHLSETIEYDLNHCLEEWRRLVLLFRQAIMNKGAAKDETADHPASLGRGKGSH